MSKYARFAAALALGTGLAMGASGPAKAETPKKGGILNFIVAAEAPSYDGHKESTFAMVHPTRPFYSLLIRVNPENPSSPTDFICDLCEGSVPKPTDGGTVYTFKVKKGVQFHDGQVLSAQDLVATYKKIIFPPEGVSSARKSFFTMVESVTAPDDETIVFKLKFPSGAFIPALATPFNYTYSAKDLKEHGYDWHEKNVNGTGAFKFKEAVAGSHVEGVRFDNYHVKGLPYLDGYKALISRKTTSSEAFGFLRTALKQSVDFIACCGLGPLVQWTVMQFVSRYRASGRTWLAKKMGRGGPLPRRYSR